MKEILNIHSYSITCQNLYSKCLIQYPLPQKTCIMLTSRKFINIEIPSFLNYSQSIEHEIVEEKIKYRLEKVIFDANLKVEIDWSMPRIDNQITKQMEKKCSWSFKIYVCVYLHQIVKCPQEKREPNKNQEMHFLKSFKKKKYIIVNFMFSYF